MAKSSSSEDSMPDSSGGAGATWPVRRPFRWAFLSSVRTGLLCSFIVAIVVLTGQANRRDEETPIWSTATGHRYGARAAAFAPDGRHLVTGGDDGSLFLWEVGQGIERELSSGDESIVFCAAFSPNGMIVASGHANFTCVLWDVTTGGKRATLTGHTRPVMCLDFAPDGATLATGGGEPDIRLWDVASGTLKAIVPGHCSGVSSVRFAPDGQVVAFGCPCGLVQRWNVSDGQRCASLGPIADGAPVLSLAFSPDGRTLAAGGLCDRLKLWDVASGLERVASPVEVQSVRDVVFAADGQAAIAMELNGNVRLRGVFARDVRTVHLGDFNTYCAAFSPGGRLLAIVNSDGTLMVWELKRIAD